jgi:hypothetical protein
VPNDLHGFVARTKVRDRWRSDKKFTGFTIGKGNILCRIYDKTLEIRAESGKIWFHPLWKNNGWDGERPVWRVEFEVHRKVLKRLGIDSVDDLWTKKDNLWSYLTVSWLQLKTPSKDKNASRRPVKRKWTVIIQAYHGYEVSPLVRTRVLQGNTDMLLAQGCGIIFRLGELNNCGSFEDALELVRQH